ncbi:MAG: hypothetical protein GXY43_06575 [Clostridiaceae bacterium]|nr:hypothetical protein [Clostridiaceae bacterium]
MSERCIRMRSSFVKVGNKRRSAIILFVLITVLLILFSGCKSTGPNDPVPHDEINESPENVARVYSESVFTGNHLLMFQCFPSRFVSMMAESDLVKSAQWGKQIQDSLLINGIEFLGTESGKAEDLSSDSDSPSFLAKAAEISQKSYVDESAIDQIATCEITLYFKRDGKDMYQTVSVITYEVEDRWYVFEMEAINV